jgi:hypothetical protein
MLHPVNVAARISRRAGLNRSQEEVLCGMLAGLGDEQLTRWARSRRSLSTVQAHRQEILQRLGWFDRWLYSYVRSREIKRRAHELQIKIAEETRTKIRRQLEVKQ